MEKDEGRKRERGGRDRRYRRGREDRKTNKTHPHVSFSDEFSRYLFSL